ncbi:MAG: RDD family protein [Acidimicrobiales bacterium]
MSDAPQTQPPGWYYAQGDPPGTQRYWDGSSWQGGPQPVPGAGAAAVADSVNGTLAEPVKRILARLIDGVIWFVIAALIPAFIGGGPFGDSSFIVAFLLSILSGAVVVAYEVVLIGTQGATFGKQALGLKIVNEDGSDPDYMTGLRRMGLYIAFIFIGLLPFIGFLAFIAVSIAGLMMLFTDSQRQTPWDKIGKTLVMEA